MAKRVLYPSRKDSLKRRKTGQEFSSVNGTSMFQYCKLGVLTRVLLFLTLFFSVAEADPDPNIEFTGNFVQGGIVIGRVQPDAKIHLGERRVRVSPEGWFVLGFGRDEKPNVVLNVEYADGKKHQQTLNVKARKYEIQRIEGLPPGKVTPSAEDLIRIKRENALISAARRRDESRTDFLSDFDWPVVGRISGVFGSQRVLNGIPKRPHYGIDVASPAGTPVKAPAPGRVTLVHQDMFYTGGTINLDHGHGLTSIFTHLSEIFVTEGQHVEKGSVIGSVGATGRATGPHLHWGMNWFRARIDPALLVGDMPDQ